MALEFKDLEKVLGRNKVYEDPSIVALYTREASGLEGAAFAVVFPETTSDVSALVKWAYKKRVPLYPQGSASSLSGNSVPDKGVVVSFERMNRIHEINIVDSIADVEPGIRINDLNLELAGKGYTFPIDPASQSVATIGGAINNGSGGLRGARYGTMRDWVNQLEVVLPDENGTVLRLGCRTVKCRTGYDLVRLIIGSEGTLALVTRAILRITPLPEASPTVLGFFNNLEDLLAVYIELKSQKLPLLMTEFMDDLTVSVAKKRAPGFEHVQGHMLLVSVESNYEAAQRIMDFVASIFKKYGATVYTAQNLGEAEAKGLLTIRRNLIPAGIEYVRAFWGKSTVFTFMGDIVVPPSKVADLVAGLRSLTERYKLPQALGGHIGDGNLHPVSGVVVGDKEASQRLYEWYLEVMKLAVRLGGSMSAEHGVGLVKKEGLKFEMEYLGSLKALEIMREIKKIFDPLNILNPGKIF